MRILVAEDDPALAALSEKAWKPNIMLWTCRRMANKHGPMAGELDFDLVVLDLNLPPA